jgi:hypothetical protein
MFLSELKELGYGFKEFHEGSKDFEPRLILSPRRSHSPEKAVFPLALDFSAYLNPRLFKARVAAIDPEGSIYRIYGETESGERRVCGIVTGESNNDIILVTPRESGILYEGSFYKPPLTRSRTGNLLREYSLAFRELNSFYETIGPENKAYLKELFGFLCLQANALSVAGMNMGRSRLGVFNELAVDTIKAVVKDDDYLYDFERPTDGPVDIPAHFKSRIDKEIGRDGDIVNADPARFNTEQVNLLTRLTALQLFGWDVIAHEDKGQGDLTRHPVGQGALIASIYLLKVVDRNDVEVVLDTVTRSPEALRTLYDRLYFEVKDILHPIDPELLKELKRGE